MSMCMFLDSVRKLSQLGMEPRIEFLAVLSSDRPKTCSQVNQRDCNVLQVCIHQNAKWCNEASALSPDKQGGLCQAKNGKYILRDRAELWRPLTEAVVKYQYILLCIFSRSFDLNKTYIYNSIRNIQRCAIMSGISDPTKQVYALTFTCTVHVIMRLTKLDLYRSSNGSSLDVLSC